MKFIIIHHFPWEWTNFTISMNLWMNLCDSSFNIEIKPFDWDYPKIERNKSEFHHFPWEWTNFILSMILWMNLCDSSFNIEIKSFYWDYPRVDPNKLEPHCFHFTMTIIRSFLDLSFIILEFLNFIKWWLNQAIWLRLNGFEPKQEGKI